MHIRCIDGMPTWHSSPDWRGSVPCGLLVATLDECADPLSDAGVPTQNLSQIDGPMAEPECSPPDLARAPGALTVGSGGKVNLNSWLTSSRQGHPRRLARLIAPPDRRPSRGSQVQMPVCGIQPSETEERT
jgi:hypothetical protein